MVAIDYGGALFGKILIINDVYVSKEEGHGVYGEHLEWII